MSKKVGPRILCVDDEPRILEGLRLNLRKFEAEMATSGVAGLEILAARPCAAVISDMRMPQMNGAEFLKAVKERWPDTVRILLTGYSEMESAIAAINEGEIFRFLTKPCAPDRLIATVNAAVEQHRLITAEKELLEKTLNGCIGMLGDIMSLTHPVAFGRSTRVKNHVAALLDAFGEKNRWHVEVAATLVEIGAVTLPDETLQKMYYGQPLSVREQVAVDQLPTVARKILGSIPRLEPVVEVLTDLGARNPGSLGARVLRVALEFDTLESRGASRVQALDTMRGKPERFDGEVLLKLAALIGARIEKGVRQIALRSVEPGMTFSEDVRTPSGMLLVARGYQATDSFVTRVKNFSEDQLAMQVRITC